MYEGLWELRLLEGDEGGEGIMGPDIPERAEEVKGLRYPPAGLLAVAVMREDV
jgi:hypothetical protein